MTSPSHFQETLPDMLKRHEEEMISSIRKAQQAAAILKARERESEEWWQQARQTLFYFVLFLMACSLVQCGEARAADWSKPGAKPYVLSIPAAVDNYRDIPPDARAELKHRMDTRQTTAMVLIRKNEIVSEGKARLSFSNLRDMHWGSERRPRLGPVTRDAWSDKDEQRAFVYCAGGHCIAVPFVCRNVSRIDLVRASAPPSPPQTGGAPLADGPTFATASAPLVPSIPPSTDSLAPLPPTHRPFGSEPMLAVWVGGFPSAPQPLMPSPILNVIASPVPEPETWALFALGASLVAFKTRKSLTN